MNEGVSVKVAALFVGPPVRVSACQGVSTCRYVCVCEVTGYSRCVVTLTHAGDSNSLTLSPHILPMFGQGGGGVITSGNWRGKHNSLSRGAGADHP